MRDSLHHDLPGGFGRHQRADDHQACEESTVRHGMWLTGRQRHTYKGRQESLSDTAGPDFSCPHRAGESLAIVGAPSPCDAGGLSGRLSGQGASRRGGATARRTAAR
ncbi:MAG: hypothetical protein WCK05_00525, partial [Planctomycetota bacterium]